MQVSTLDTAPPPLSVLPHPPNAHLSKIPLQINLQTLTQDTTLSTTVVKVTKGTWNRIVLKDISGGRHGE